MGLDFPLLLLLSLLLLHNSKSVLSLSQRRQQKIDTRFYFGIITLVLVDFDGAVDLPNEEERGVEADGARQQPEGDDHDDGVGEVEQGGHEFVNVQLGVEVEDGVGEHVERGPAGDAEGAPPPVVVLGAELEKN